MDKPIKAISLWQPFASLVAWGEKQYETRSWSTNYRGWLVIHAAKRPVSVGDFFFERDIINAAITRHAGKWGYAPYHMLPLGAGLCVARLVAVHPVEDIRRKLSDKERAFGLYSAGRFAWELTDVQPFPQPIPARGAQGLWNWTQGLPEGVHL